MRLKKLLAVMLAIVLSLAVITPAFAYTEDFELFTPQLRAAEEVIVAALSSGENTVDISEFELNRYDVEDGKSIYKYYFAVLDDHPELIDVKGSASINPRSDGVVLNIYAARLDEMTPEAIAAANAVIDAMNAEAGAYELNDLDRVLFAVNLIKECMNEGDPALPKNNTAYSLLAATGNGITTECRALVWALKALGVKAYLCDADDPYPEDDQITCPYVLVVTGGRGYLIDPKNFDPCQTDDSLILVSEELLRQHRMKNNDMSATNAMYACGWKNITGLCMDKTDESAWWNLTCASGMGYLNGWWYFTDGVDLYRGRTSDPANYTKLTSHNPNAYRWQYGNWKLFDIVTGGDCIYFNTPDSILRYDPATGVESTLYTLSAAEKANGTIVDIKRSGNEIIYMISDTFSASMSSGYFTATGSVVYACDSHAFGDWTTADPGNCVTPATEKRVCTVCGMTEIRATSVYGGHVFGEWTQTVAPTSCQPAGAGVETRVCTLCGAPETRVKQGAHVYGDWVETRPATCGDSGEKTRSCVYDCGAAETKAIPATGAHVDADGNGVCDVCSLVIGTPQTGFAAFFARIMAFFAAIAAFFRRLFGGA